MKRYLVLIAYEPWAWADASADVRQGYFDAHHAFERYVDEHGERVSSAALGDADTATTVRGADRVVTDGPFAELTEQVGGYYDVAPSRPRPRHCGGSAAPGDVHGGGAPGRRGRGVRVRVTPEEALAGAVRDEWGRLVALLVGQFRRLDLVEDALGDAVEAAARRWPADGVPDRPAAWLLTAARRRLLDRLRAEAMAARKEPLLVVDAERPGGGAMADPGDLVEDDRLRLVLLCCHPALAPEVASALALRLVVGVTTADIARLFLVPEATMAARITRGKKKIVAAGIPYGVPGAADLPARMRVVAQTAYLAFTAGYAPGSGPDLLRTDLAGEAVRLVRVTLALRPDEPVLRALLALVLLQHSRRDARVGPDGALVLLPDQDRSLWHHDEVAEAVPLLAGVGPSPDPLVESYRLQAVIAAEHALAADPGRHPLGPHL